MKRIFIPFLALVIIAIVILVLKTRVFSNAGPVFTFTYENAEVDQTMDGRLLLFLADNNERPPRYQVSDGPSSQLVYGIDVEGWEAGEEMRIDASAFGYPVESLADLPEGTYYAQALFHVYETFSLNTGHTVKLPMNRGAGQNMQRAPGNMYSEPVEVQLTKSKNRFALHLDQINPPIPEPEDSKYIKHIKIKSTLLSEFWGRDIYLGAHILLPEGFDEHPEAHYPLCVFHGHYPADFGGFRTEPPEQVEGDEYNERFNISSYRQLQQQEAYDFYKTWTSDDFPRMLIVKIQHANPYYDDSYAVNSANLGPYGDAITYELIPEIESRFRGIGEGWARFLYGGSTGGWEALAAQVFYPDDYNGCFAACPDPIDFSAYTLVDLYTMKNAYYLESPWKKTAIPGHRNWLGEVSSTLEDQNLRELALGTNSRSGGQWDIWQAVYSPMGAEGYPQPIWDKKTGDIDPEVAAYWKENYDLRYILERDWKTLGPKLQGKLHIYVGDMDNYYLNNAVYKMEEFLESTTGPYYYGEVEYGDRAEHCWNGDHELPNYISRLRYNTMYVDKMLKLMQDHAPQGADLYSWRY